MSMFIKFTCHLMVVECDLQVTGYFLMPRNSSSASPFPADPTTVFPVRLHQKEAFSSFFVLIPKPQVPGMHFGALEG